MQWGLLYRVHVAVYAHASHSSQPNLEQSAFVCSTDTVFASTSHAEHAPPQGLTHLEVAVNGMCIHAESTLM